MDAWRKRCEGRAFEPLEARIADVVAMHPEYHAMLEDSSSLERDFAPEAGIANPYLHLAMHVALLEQRASDRPPGVVCRLDALARRTGDAHAAEHEAMECLREALWQAQRAGSMPDEARYLECLRARARRRR